MKSRIVAQAFKSQSALGSLGDTRRASKAGAVSEADCDGGVAA